MKRFLFYVCSLTLVLVITLATMGIVNYINEQDKLNNTNIENSVSADIYDMQLEISTLYLSKYDYEKEKAEIEAKLEDLSENDEATNNEITALSQRLVEVETKIAEIESEIQEINNTITEIYNLINANDRSVMTLCLPSQHSMNGNDFVNLPLTLYCSSGSSLIYKDNAVYVGKNVSKILVSANVFVGADGVAGDRSIMINKNDLYAVHSNAIFDGDSSSHVLISPCLLSVQENDYIKLSFQSCSTGDSIWGTPDYMLTYFTVEVVE